MCDDGNLTECSYYGCTALNHCAFCVIVIVPVENEMNFVQCFGVLYRFLFAC